jgi:hypothetical protein
MLVACDNPSPPDSPSPGHGDPASAGQVGTGGEAACHWQFMHKIIFIYERIDIVVEQAGAVVTFTNAVIIVIFDKVIRSFI